jgi:hypothetical protein
MRINSSGRVLVGTSSARNVGRIVGNTNFPNIAQLGIEGTGEYAATSLITNRADNTGSFITLGKTRSASAGGVTSVNNDDDLGGIYFAGADGTDVESLGAAIQCQVDGAPGSNDMPGRLIFKTTADGASSPTERMRIDSSGNVLIGTTTANGNMTVNMGTDKNISFSGSQGEVGSVPAFVAANDDGSSLASMGFRATDLRFATGSSERMRIDSSGRLLLGTTTEGQVSADNFTVADSGNAGITIRSGTSGFGNLFFSDGTSGNDEFRGAVQYNHSTDTLTLKSNALDRVYVDSSGRVGIGNSSPSRKLHIHDGSGSSAQILQIDAGGVGLLSIQSGTTSESRIEFGDSSNDDAGYIYYENDNDVMKFGVNASERMRIDSSGRVLIGTSSSEAFNGIASALQIEGNTDTKTRISLYRTQNDASGSVLVFAKARNTSHALLQNDDTIGKIEWYGADGNDTNQRAAIIAAEVDGAPTGNDMPGRITFSTTPDNTATPVERMRIDSSGKTIFSGTGDGIVELTTTDSRGAFMRFGQGGSYHNMVGCADGITSGDKEDLGLRAADNVIIATGGSTERMRIDSSGRVLVGRTSSTGSGEDIQDSKGGIRSIPQNSKTSAYTLVVGDVGKHINITTGGVTVPASVFSVGDAVTIYNDSSSNQTVTQGSSVTLRSAGTADTGNRTLAQRGICTVLCVGSNEFVISGAGLS